MATSKNSTMTSALNSSTVAQATEMSHGSTVVTLTPTPVSSSKAPSSTVEDLRAARYKALYEAVRGLPFDLLHPTVYLNQPAEVSKNKRDEAVPRDLDDPPSPRQTLDAQQRADILSSYSAAYTHKPGGITGFPSSPTESALSSALASVQGNGAQNDTTLATVVRHAEVTPGPLSDFTKASETARSSALLTVAMPVDEKSGTILDPTMEQPLQLFVDSTTPRVLDSSDRLKANFNSRIALGRHHVRDVVCTSFPCDMRKDQLAIALIAFILLAIAIIIPLICCVAKGSRSIWGCLGRGRLQQSSRRTEMPPAYAPENVESQDSTNSFELLELPKPAHDPSQC